MSEDEPPVSPFEKYSDISFVLYESISVIPLYGAYTLQGYETIELTACLTYPVITCESDWGGWQNLWLELDCVTKWETCCCWGIDSTTIFPDITFAIEGDIPIKLEVSVDGFVLPEETPPEPILTGSVTIEPFKVVLSANELKFELVCLEEPYHLLSDDEFQFETNVSLPSWEYTVNIGFDYTFRLYLDYNYNKSN